MISISIVVETWNTNGALAPVARLLDTLPEGCEIIVTHAGPRGELGRAIRWVPLPASAGYYDHKNAGFAATTGEIVAFVDGDCEPAANWLAALTAPIADGRARVVAGVTTYRGALAPLASRLDFPYFARDRANVRNFFANNVAFARDVFAARPYPALPMFHGQCQVLALRLHEAGIAIHLAHEARVVHAWPGSVGEWLEIRLLRGADTVELLPHVVAHYAPRALPLVARHRRLAALAVLAARGVTGSLAALARAPRVRGLALVGAVTLADSLGAAAGPAVYRAFGATA